MQTRAIASLAGVTLALAVAFAIFAKRDAIDQDEETAGVPAILEQSPIVPTIESPLEELEVEATQNRSQNDGGIASEAQQGFDQRPPSWNFAADDPMVDSRFELEPVDPDWAPSMEGIIDGVVRSIGAEISEVREVQCRTTVCRAIVVHNETLKTMDDDTRRQIFLPAMRQFSQSMRPIVENSNGRLNAIGVSQVVPVAADEPWITVFSVRGPRIDDSSPNVFE